MLKYREFFELLQKFQVAVNERCVFTLSVDVFSFGWRNLLNYLRINHLFIVSINIWLLANFNMKTLEACVFIIFDFLHEYLPSEIYFTALLKTLVQQSVYFKPIPSIRRAKTNTFHQQCVFSCPTGTRGLIVASRTFLIQPYYIILFV